MTATALSYAPDKTEITLIDMFAARCEARAMLVDVNMLDLHDAVDGLQADALAQGLVAAIGQPGIQEIMSAAFGQVLR